MSDQPLSGAACHKHDGRPANFQCPKCNRSWCLFCYQPTFGRCETCLAAAPQQAAAPVPFEDASLGGLARITGTFAGAFSPVRSAPAFAHEHLGRALTFALLTALPLSLLSGIIPNTRHLGFGGGSMRVLDEPSPEAIAWDIARAMAIQLAMHGTFIMGLFFPYTSLVRAYGRDGNPFAARRVVLYRAWLVPAATLLTGLIAWVAPVPAEGEVPGVGLALAVSALQTLPVLLLLSMGFAARFAAGVGRGWTLVTVTVALLVAFCTTTVTAMTVFAAFPRAAL